MLPHFRRALPSVALVLVVADGGKLATGETPTRDQLRAAIKQTWESIESIAYHVDQVPAGDREAVSGGAETQRFQVTLATGGRFAARRFFEGKSGAHRGFDVRSDGHDRYRLVSADDDPKAIARLDVENLPANPWERISSISNDPLWVILPGGRPVFEHIRPETRVELVEEDGAVRAEVYSQHKSRPLKLTLDGRHGWWPARVEMERLSLEVTRFERVGGYDFPKAGRATYTTPGPNGREMTQEFTTSDIRINGPIDETIFVRPMVPNGTMVTDAIRQTHGPAGGIAARPVASKVRNVSTATGSRPVTQRRRGGPSLQTTLFLVGISAIMLGGVGIWMKRR